MYYTKDDTVYIFFCLTVNAAAQRMSSSAELYLKYEGLLVPKDVHTIESLTFAQKFPFKDDDVVAVTYPKSGQWFFLRRLGLIKYCL